MTGSNTVVLVSRYVEELAKYAGVPVWNGLTNEFHPTQILADFMTMLGTSGKPLNQSSLCYLGMHVIIWEIRCWWVPQRWEWISGQPHRQNSNRAGN